MALPFRCHQNDESTERRRGGRFEIGDRERSVHAVPMRMRRLSGLELHFMRRSSSCIRSSDGTSSRFAAISAAAAAEREELNSRALGASQAWCSSSWLARLGRVGSGVSLGFSFLVRWDQLNFPLCPFCLSLFSLLFRVFYPYHYNFQSLEKRHYYSSISKHTITIFRFSQK